MLIIKCHRHIMSVNQDALRLFVAQGKERLSQLLQRLQWTAEGVQKQHRPKASFEHAENAEDQLPPSCMQSTEHSVQLNTDLQQQLLGTAVSQTPQTFDELQSNYTAAQKLTLYEHVLSCTPRQRISFEENANFAELVAVTRRELKKKRRHRKSKPTLHEEMHQLVELQMLALEEQVREQERQKQQKQQQRHPRPHHRAAVSPGQEHQKRFSSRERQREHRGKRERESYHNNKRHYFAQSSHSSRYYKRSHYN